MTGMTACAYENCKNFGHRACGDSPLGGGGSHAGALTPSVHQKQSRQVKRPAVPNFFTEVSSLDSIAHQELRLKAVCTP